jgi:gamma-glutamylcyclotransferase (GGCT)/AIG2-like uncharacterized protein YtfP
MGLIPDIFDSSPEALARKAEAAKLGLHLDFFAPPEVPAPRLEATQHQRSGESVKYGKWITVGGREGEDGKKHGGSPVYIENGVITKGHPGLMGSHISHLQGKEKDLGPRQASSSEKAGKVAELLKRADAKSIPAKKVHNLARQIMGHDAEFKKELIEVLNEARGQMIGLGYGDPRTLVARSGKGKLDADSVRGLDDVAQNISRQYPHFFHGDENGTERLFDLLMSGTPKPLTEEEAYEQAVDHLENEGAEEEEIRQQTKHQPGEEVPFQRTEEAVPYYHPEQQRDKGKFVPWEHAGRTLLFVFGTLEDRDKLAHVLGKDEKDVPEGEPAALPGWKWKLEAGGYPTIVPCSGEELTGKVFWADPEDVKKLKAWETRYKLTRIELKGGREAWAFVREE